MEAVEDSRSAATRVQRQARRAYAMGSPRVRTTMMSRMHAPMATSMGTRPTLSGPQADTVHHDPEDPESTTTEPEYDDEPDEDDAEIVAGEVEDDEEEDEEQQDDEEEIPPSPTLREISSLASWTVSTYKPGCGVKELLSPSMMQFWQSDGPQPHLLTIHFFKVVSIVRMRIYLHQELDESYTPTRMVFAAGMGEHDLVEFAEWKVGEEGSEPRGWLDVDLDGVGGRDSGRGYGNLRIDDENRATQRGEDEGKVLRCMVVQIRVMENHQNGKDTHVRGVQLFARDERMKRTLGRVIPVINSHQDAQQLLQEMKESKSNALLEPEWAREVELR